MKLALIGAAAVAAAALATPALAQAVVADHDSRTQFYYSANRPNLDGGVSGLDGSNYRDRGDTDAVMSRQVVEPNAYRYHGGPKYND